MKIITLVLLLLSINASAKYRKNVIENFIDERRVATPVENEVCFSPDEPCAIKLSRFLSSAKESIDLAIYDINEDQIVHALLMQSKKIKVRVIVDKKQAKGSHSKVALLLKAGIDLKFGYQRGIMHDKFVIIDGKELETGSFNYTHHAASANQENQLYIFNNAIVEKYKIRFEKMWQTAR